MLCDPVFLFVPIAVTAVLWLFAGVVDAHDEASRPSNLHQLLDRGSEAVQLCAVELGGRSPVCGDRLIVRSTLLTNTRGDYTAGGVMPIGTHLMTLVFAVIAP